ncbi:MAG: S8 family serine peptidase [Candidatus Korarchaeota archaeon]
MARKVQLKILIFLLVSLFLTGAWGNLRSALFTRDRRGIGWQLSRMEILGKPVYSAQEHFWANIGRSGIFISRNIESLAFSYVHGYADPFINVVHADVLWMDNLTGEGVVVAVMDSGIDITHEALRPYGHLNFSAKVIGWYDPINNISLPYDDNGHGTACASIVAGDAPNFKGIAPKAKLVGIKVLDSKGRGDSNVFLDGVNWILTNKDTYNISIVSISLGSDETSDGNDPLSLAIDMMVQNGLVVVISAGNFGPRGGSVGIPGTSRWGITVGAAESSAIGEIVATYSSRGPTQDGRIKPEIVAPGSVRVARVNSTDGYEIFSGTSAAAPIAAGLAAIIKQKHPEYTPFDIKNILVMCTLPLSSITGNNDEGYGIVRGELIRDFLQNEPYNFTHASFDITPGRKNGILLRINNPETRRLTISSAIFFECRIRLMRCGVPEGMPSVLPHYTDPSNTSLPTIVQSASGNSRIQIDIPPGNWVITLTIRENIQIPIKIELQPFSTGVEELDIFIDIMTSPVISLACIVGFGVGFVIGVLRKRANVKIP